MPLPKILMTGDDRLATFPDRRHEGPSDLVVGWREWAGMPDLGIVRVEAKVDTGARSSALHVNSIEAFERDDSAWVRFEVTGESASVPLHESPVADLRRVRSSNGEAELRFVIRTSLTLAGQVWPIDVTLTNRERMELPMLIGREALAGRALVDAARSWLWGRPPRRPRSQDFPADRPSPLRRRRAGLGDSP